MAVVCYQSGFNHEGAMWMIRYTLMALCALTLTACGSQDEEKSSSPTMNSPFETSMEGKVEPRKDVKSDQVVDPSLAGFSNGNVTAGSSVKFTPPPKITSRTVVPTAEQKSQAQSVADAMNAIPKGMAPEVIKLVACESKGLQAVDLGVRASRIRSATSKVIADPKAGSACMDKAKS